MANPNSGTFLPIIFDFDIAALTQINVQSNEFKELMVRLYQYINEMAIAINNKNNASYPLQEFLSGKQIFPNPALSQSTLRPAYVTTINFGALPNTGTKSVPHHIPITKGYSFINIYGSASDQTGLNYIPIPYASPVLANNIEISIDATNVNITTGSNRTNFNVCIIFLEYMKY